MVTIQVQAWLLYVQRPTGLGDQKVRQPSAILMASSEEHAITSFRQQMLGQKDAPAPEDMSAQPALTAPFEDLMRVAMIGLYVRMFQADMMMAQAARQGH